MSKKRKPAKALLGYLIDKPASPKIIIVLISLIVTAIVLAFLIPQVGNTPSTYFTAWKARAPKSYWILDTLQLTHIYSANWFLFLVLLSALFLAKSIFLQYKRIRLPQTTTALKRIKPICSRSDLALEKLSAIMGQRGFFLHDKTENFYLFTKHDFAKWASVLFHSGILLLILAGVWRLAYQQHGFITIIEGDIFDGQYEKFSNSELGLFQNRFDSGVKIYLNEFKHKFWPTDKLKEISSNIVFLDNNNQKIFEAEIAINHPVRYNGVTIHQTFNYGYAISFKFTSIQGTETQANFILDQQLSKNDPARGKTDFPFTPYIFTMQFYPDISRKSFLIGSPILYLSVTHFDGRNIFNGLVLPGDTIMLEGNKLNFNRFSYWSGLDLEKNQDLLVAYGGFFLVCIGAGLMFLFTPQKVLFSLGNHEILIYGWSKRFKALFHEEIKRLGRLIETL